MIDMGMKEKVEVGSVLLYRDSGCQYEGRAFSPIREREHELVPGVYIHPGSVSNWMRQSGKTCPCRSILLLDEAFEANSYGLRVNLRLDLSVGGRYIISGC